MTESTGGIDMDEETSGVVKKFLYVNRKAPYGTIYALESLEVVSDCSGVRPGRKSRIH